MKSQYQWAVVKEGNEYEVEHLSLTITEKDKTKKECVYKNFPVESEFPGGTGWVDDEKKPIRNPFYMMALKYAKDHEFGPRRREGETEFTLLMRPESGERKQPVRSAETVANDQEASFEKNPQEFLKTMALRRMARKGGDYESNLAFVTEEWT